ncbi:unannotated protein [freshwater metagenome]|uniref:Unannotated protein n=1 Tax=freshwater metagenome TaxID=449393 RepID=A0A6J6X7Q1_9ZZZZ
MLNHLLESSQIAARDLPHSALGDITHHQHKAANFGVMMVVRPNNFHQMPATIGIGHSYLYRSSILLALHRAH